jgi:hypothetical protein
VRPFALIRRDPVLLAAELTWRWSFSLGSLAILFLVFRRIQQALTLSGADELSLSRGTYIEFVQTLMGVVATALPLVGTVALWALVALAALWIAAATIGRGTVTHAIVRHLAEERGTAFAPRFSWFAMAIAHFARVFTLLIPLIGYLLGGLFSALILRAGGAPAAEPGLATLLAATLAFCFVFFSALTLWSIVHFVVALAPLFIARDGRGALDAIADAISFSRRCWRQLSADATQNAVLRSAVALGITVAAVVVGAIMLRTAPLLASILLCLLTLAYLVASDWLLLARTIAYAAIAQNDRAAAPSPNP